MSHTDLIPPPPPTGREVSAAARRRSMRISLAAGAAGLAILGTVNHFAAPAGTTPAAEPAPTLINDPIYPTSQPTATPSTPSTSATPTASPTTSAPTPASPSASPSATLPTGTPVPANPGIALGYGATLHAAPKPAKPRTGYVFLIGDRTLTNPASISTALGKAGRPVVGLNVRPARTATDGYNVLHHYVANGHLPSRVVVSLGANDTRAAFAKAVTRILADVGPRHVVYWVTPLGADSKAKAKYLKALAAKNPNLRVIDTTHAIGTHGSWVSADDVSLTAAGIRGYTRIITAALSR